MRWTTLPIHVLDFEGSRRSGILEFGVATVVAGHIVATQTGLCRATGPIPLADARVHGLREGDLAEAPAFATHWERFRELRATGLLAAHHAPVEQGLLKHVWPYPPFSPSWGTAPEPVADWGPWVDTCRLAAAAAPALPSHALGEVVAAWGLAEPLAALAAQHCPAGRRHAHCALYDALAAALVLGRLATEPAWAELTTAQLVAV